jgi:hypothetical protein
MAAALALQKAVFDTLTDDATLTSKVSEVFDGFPDFEKTPVKFPFITIGDSNSNSFTAFEHMGEEVFFNIHIWSRYKGFKEGLEITADVQRLLAQKEITVDGFGDVGCFFESSDTTRDVDGITRHIILRYRFLIQH